MKAPHRLRRVGLLGVVFALACGVDDDGHPELHSEPRSMAIWVTIDGTVEHQLYLLNRGDGALEITDMTPSLPWVSISPKTFVIPPAGQDSATVSVVASSVAAGIHSGRILVASNDPNRPMSAIPTEIRVVEPPVSIVTTPELFILALSADDSAAVSCTVANMDDATHQVTAVSSQCFWVVPTPEWLRLNPGETGEISLGIRSHGLHAGRNRCTVQIHTTDPNAPLQEVVVDLTVGIDGGVPRVVVAEEFTGTWCQYCPSAMMGLHDLQKRVGTDRLAVIAYHRNDSFSFPDGDARGEFYEVTSVPKVVFDGTEIRTGGSTGTPMDYTPEYLRRERLPAPLTILLSLTAYDAGSGSGTVRAMCRNVSSMVLDGSMVMAMTAIDSLHSWQGVGHLYATALIMPLGSRGLGVSLESAMADTIAVGFTTPSGWESRDREIIVFVQDSETSEIHQGARLRLP